MSSPKLVIGGRYRLDEPLASGGMGVVWRGWDQRLERVVAIKQIHLQPGRSASETNAARDRAMREARITARLHHPGAVPIYDVVEHDGQPCLIMQFLPSVSLQATLTSQRTLPTVDVARIGSELAAALTAAHQVGIVHRDVKPGNVLLAEDGSAKLTDFGISHALGDVSLTSTGMVTGTPAFLAPEVARGQSATYASDVYSLGATLYTATEGRPPVEHDDNAMAVLHRVASGELTPPRRSGPLTPLLVRMLDPNPAVRPGMEHAWSALAALHQNLTATATAAGGPESATAVLSRQYPSTEVEAQSQTAFTTRPVRQATSGPRSHRALLLVALLAATASLAVGLVYLLTGSGRDAGTVRASTPASTTRATARGSSTGARSASTTTRAASRTTAPVSSSPSSQSPPTTSGPTTTTSSAPSTSSSSSGSIGTQLAKAITDYYALMPTDVNAGWARLSPAYQSGHAGGFRSYQRFWAAVKTVSTSDVVGQPPDSTTATITYRYKDGRTVVERTRFGFVLRSGQWLISTSTTLNSRTI